MSKQPIKHYRRIRRNQFKEWFNNGKGNSRFKIKFNNGKWMIVRFENDGALYSVCTVCNDYIHSCSYMNDDFIICYDEEGEFIYCPNCGNKNLPDRKSPFKTNEMGYLTKRAPNYQDLSQYYKDHLYKL